MADKEKMELLPIEMYYANLAMKKLWENRNRKSVDVANEIAREVGAESQEERDRLYVIVRELRMILRAS